MCQQIRAHSHALKSAGFRQLQPLGRTIGWHCQQITKCRAMSLRYRAAAIALADRPPCFRAFRLPMPSTRSEEHTSELQSLMRISYAVFCLKKKTTQNTHTQTNLTIYSQPTHQ